MRKKLHCSRAQTPWLLREKYPTDILKRKLSSLSLRVRQEQLELFFKYLKPKKSDRVIDVGVSSVETLAEINFFEKKYPFPERLTAVSIDEPLDFPKRYPQIKFLKVQAGEKLPFDNKSFDIAVSWATLEHVGDEKKQKFFLSELFRIGKKVFITTPYRGCFYEPHSELFFVHWLPRKWFQKICRLLKKDFWVSEDNLRCLWIKEVRELLPKTEKTEVIVYKTFGFIPSHLIIIGQVSPSSEKQSFMA